MKRNQADSPEPKYEPIWLPKNSGMGLIIAGFAFMFGFAIVWHIWWLATIALLAVIVSVIVRTTSDDQEVMVSVKEIAETEARRKEFAV